MTSWRILTGDVLDKLAELPDESVHCCVTSPPYWGLRNYQVDGQLGLEKTPDCGRPFVRVKANLTDKQHRYVAERLSEFGLL